MDAGTRQGLVNVVEKIADDDLDITDAVAAIAATVLGSSDFDGVLHHLAKVTKSTIPGAYEVSVTMTRSKPRTVACTAEFATRVDEFQYEGGSGPCLDALRSGETVLVSDQLTETRWPHYSAAAADAGVRSSVSVPLRIEERYSAALNVYGVEPNAFSPAAIRAVEQLGTYGVVLISNAELYFTAASRADQMAEAMTSRAVIEQAKGVLMGGRRCSADDAFAILVKLSQQTGRKLRQVAQAVVDEVTPAPETDGAS
jgi:GAF domain-containing protein